MTDASDEELLAAVGAGPGAFPEFYRRHVAKVTGMGVRRFDGAEDVAPAADGGFCLYFAPDERSGPNGRTCVPGDGGEVRTRVGDSGFFGAPVPRRAEGTFVHLQERGPKDPPTKDGAPMRVFDLSRIADVRVVALDAHGTPVAHGVTSPDWIAG
jgi:hypothetical protein